MMVLSQVVMFANIIESLFKATSGEEIGNLLIKHDVLIYSF
jgi:hypothetical protein